jgi:hypothetical protein
MKKYLLLLSLIFSTTLWAWNDEYQFQNFTRVDDFSFQETVLEHRGWSIVIFNRGYCPFNNSKNRCFPFESQVEQLSAQILGRISNMQLINIDTESSSIHHRYDVKAGPTVLFLLDGREMERLEPYFCYPHQTNNQCDYQRLSWSHDLLKRTWEVIIKIPMQ